jgi:pectate lyase
MTPAPSTTIPVAVAAIALAIAGMTSAHAAEGPAAGPDDAASTGWASTGSGTDGGAGAPASSTYVVTDRAELRTALNNGGRPADPKAIYVVGTIHGNETDDGRFLTAADYAPSYDLEKYLSCFGPDGWSDSLHAYCGDQRRARVTGSNNLKRQIEINVPSNTTLLGVADDAGFDSAYLVFHLASDIVVRNLTIEAPLDHFTSWDPYDGEDGSWNARFDAVSLVTASNVWLDHLTLTDGRYPDSSAPTGPNGKPVNFHDGLLDIKDGSDLVTVTNSRFLDHDKAILLGSGDDNADTDAGRLRVTFAGNAFDGVCQRSPRVRFGQVHVLNNYYSGSVVDPMSPLRSAAVGGHCYYLGLGYESSVVSENNAFDYTGPGADTSIIVQNWNAERFVDSGSWFRGEPVDLNALVDGVSTDVGWDPGEEYHYEVLSGYDAIKWHGKHATGAGTISVLLP